VFLLASVLLALAACAASGQPGYEGDEYRRLNETDPIDRIYDALDRWGRVFLIGGAALLALLGLRLVAPWRLYGVVKDNSLQRAIRGVDDLLKRIQAEAEVNREDTADEQAEEGLLAGMAEVAEFEDAEHVPAYVLTVNDLMLDNVRVTLKKLRHHNDGNADRYKEYMFSVLQGIKTITEQSTEAGVNSGLAVDVQPYFRDDARYKAWTKVLAWYAKHGLRQEVAHDLLGFTKRIHEGRSPLAPAAMSDLGEDTAVSPALDAPGPPRVLNEETLPAIQHAAAEQAKTLCDWIATGAPGDTAFAWQFELVRRQQQVHERAEAQRMLSVFLSSERKALLAITKIRMLPCRTWDHVLHMLGVERGDQLQRRVAERLLSIQETIILEKVFLQTFARRDKLTPVYGKGEAAGLMRDVHVPEIRRQSLAFLRRLHETEPGRLDAATEALDEEETPRNHQVHTLIQRYVCQSDRSTDRKPGVI
jgi:hypothetical protein